MLHEILLALAGGPSPLFTLQENKSESLIEEKRNPLQAYLAPAEQALIRSLAQDLGQKNKDIRTSASIVSASHSSIVCRSVAISINSVHLAEFQRKILEVEKDILAKNSNIVGAYNIVPLSAIVGAFDGWGRKLGWLWNLMCFMRAHKGTRDSKSDESYEHSCTAAKVISYLRESIHTGYPDIEAMSRELVKVAETTWLKQVSSWVLYGRYPANGHTDFLITQKKANMIDVHNVQDSLVPPFVSKATAHSILFIGKSLNHIRDRQSNSKNDSITVLSSELNLLPKHLAHLSSLEYPMNPSSFSAAIGAIRLSLSQNALQKLLPVSKVLEILHILKDFFLLTRGEFAVALLTAADDRLASRSKTQRSNLGTGNDLASMTISEGEVTNVLARTWATLASLQTLDDESTDEELDHARELMSLSIKSMEASNARSREPLAGAATASFDDLLLPSSTVLSLHVPSPLDLFLTSSEVNIYSHIHAYLLAIRRAHLRLSKLFTLSALRREHLSSKSMALRNQRKEPTARTARHNTSQKSKNMRPIWASIGSAVFFLAEIGEYFQGEVIQSSWSKFHSWLVPNLALDATQSADSSLISSLGVAEHSQSSRPTSSRSGPDPTTHSAHDPETMTQAHKSYLHGLKTALLLDDVEFTNQLRRFMTLIDHLSALMHRLDTIWQNSNSEFSGNGMGSIFSNYTAEEHTVMEDLETSQMNVTEGVQGLVDRLRANNAARANESHFMAPAMISTQDDYTPWASRGVDRLLLKFDFGKVDNLALPQLKNL